MSDPIGVRLLRGEFICEESDPAAFRKLSRQPEVKAQVDAWLNGADRRLAETNGGGAFFCTWRDSSRAEPQEVRAQLDLFTKKNQSLWHFFCVIQEASRSTREIHLSPGDPVELAPLAQAVSSNESLGVALRRASTSLSALGEAASYLDLARRACEHLEKQGYLVLKDKARGKWAISGKIELLHDVSNFIREHAPAEAFPQASEMDREALREQSASARESAKAQSGSREAAAAALDRLIEDEREEAQDDEPMAGEPAQTRDPGQGAGPAWRAEDRLGAAAGAKTGQETDSRPEAGAASVRAREEG